MLKHSLRFVPSCFVSFRFLSALVCTLFCLTTGDLWAPKRPREEDSIESDSIAGRVRKRRRTDGSSVATPSPPQSPSKETAHSLTAWFKKLADAQKRQTCPEIEQIEASFNSFMQNKVLLDKGFSFESLIVRDAAGKADVVALYHDMPASLVSEDLPILAWHGQSAREAFGGSVFLNLALDKPHRLMVMHALRPLYAFAQKQKDLSEALAESRAGLDDILEDHPYTRRRFALYALALSTRFHNPIAALILECAMHRLCPNRHSKTLDIICTETERSLQANARSISLLGDWAQTPLYANLKGDDLKDEPLLKDKVDLGLVHYAVSLGRLMIKSRDEWSEEKSKKRRDYYAQAANGFDAEACYRLTRWYYGETYSENDFFAATRYRYTDKEQGAILAKGKEPFNRSIAHGHQAAWEDDRMLFVYWSVWEPPKEYKWLFSSHSLFKALKKRLRHLRPPENKRTLKPKTQST